MREEIGKLKFDAILVVDKSDPSGLVDLYVDEEEYRTLLELWRANHARVALRIKGVG